MTHVIYFGLNDFHLTTTPFDNQGQTLSRVLFPKYTVNKDGLKVKKKGELELCFTQVICADNNTFLIDNNSELWAFGNSQQGQLGLLAQSITMPVNLSAVTKTGFKYVNAGSTFVAAYSTTKRLYVWGQVQQLKNAEHLRCEKVSFIEFLDNKYELHGLDITPHFSSKNHQSAEVTALRCASQSVYIATQERLYSLAAPLDSPSSFVGLACSSTHALAWDRQGRVFSWGEYADGKLGYMQFDVTSQDHPLLVENLQTKIIQCACGEGYSIALDVRGEVYTWGKGPFKLDLVRAVEPTRIFDKPVKPIIKVMAGAQHFGALSLDGRLYTWGVNSKGCLFEQADETRTPQLMDLKGLKIIDASMGSVFTVIVVSARTNYVIPNMNIQAYQQHQKARVHEQANLIDDRKNRMEQPALPYLSRYAVETPSRNDRNVEKTMKQLTRMKTLIDLKKSVNLKSASKLPDTLVSEHLETSFMRRIDTQIPQDDVQQKLRELENQSAMFLPVISKYNSAQRLLRSTDHDLEGLLSTHNDVLKFQYIQMVKDQDEDQIMMMLLEDKSKASDDYSLNQSLPRKPKEERKRKRKRGFHDKFDQFSPSLLEDVRKEVFNLKVQRRRTEEKKRKRLWEEKRRLIEEMEEQARRNKQKQQKRDKSKQKVRK